MYAYEAARPDATGSNAGIGDSRACSKPGRLPWTSANYADARAACAAIRDSAGQPMRLCSSSEWESACLAGGSGSPRWSYATSPATYVAGTCNDSNSTAGGPWPGGTNGSGGGNQCYSTWSGNRIYDLSGNVSEWTSTLVTLGSQSYYRVRGGNYQTFPLGTACGFNLVLEQPTFQNFDLGFRCCSSNAP
jgi:formylglycine-generating enzyme required for sulfatase activity